jgi:hypothetical protein
MKSEKLQELLQLRRAVRVRPKHATDQTIHGFPVLLSEKFLLLNEIREFHLDGYALIPLKNIYAIRSSKPERMIEKILTSEGVYDKVGITYDVNLDDFQEFFRSLQQRAKHVMIEMLQVDEDMIEEAFCIGRVVGMSKRSVAIMNYDDTGNWDTEPTVINYKHIKWVTFDSEYVNIFGKYVE